MGHRKFTLRRETYQLKGTLKRGARRKTPHGYEKIADTVVKVCKTHLEKLDSAASLVSAGPVRVKPKTYYWRGFVSPVGSLRPTAHVAAYKAAHPGGGGKWRSKPITAGKNATTPSGGHTAPPYYRRN
jgi:hypothetical protein